MHSNFLPKSEALLWKNGGLATERSGYRRLIVARQKDEEEAVEDGMNQPEYRVLRGEKRK